MSIIIPANSAVGGGFGVDNGVRMNRGSSDYFRRTNNTAGTSDKIGTYSGWVKRSTVSLDGMMFEGKDLGANNYTQIYFQATGKLTIYGSTGPMDIVTTALFRDPSAWYHIVVAFDTTQGTASNRVKIYVNGVQITSVTNGNGNAAQYPAENSTIYFAVNGDQQGIGIREDGALLWNGYMSEIVYVDGQALAPTSFGEFGEDSSTWKPIDVSGLTFGNNGCYLDFEDASNLGNVVAGNSTDFTENGLTSIDQTTDTCTNNFCTLNPLNMSNASYVFTEGNLKGANSGAWLGGTSTFFVNKGKWYWEYKYGSGNFGMGIGQAETSATYIKQLSTSNTGYISYNANGFEFFQNGSDTFNRTNNGNVGSYGSQATSGQIVMIAYDADNGKLFAGKSGTFFNSSNPATGASPMFSVTSSAYFTPSLSIESGVHEINFGSPPYSESGGQTDGNGYGNFAHAPPSGFFSLCTKNLAEYG